MVVGLPVVLNIVTKMKLNSHILIKFLIFLAFTASMATPVFAESRSATVRISCTILPMLEVSAPKLADPIVGTNLGKTSYQVSQTLVQRPEGLLKLYSVTAL